MDKAEPRYCNGVLSLGLPKLAGRDVKRLEVTFEEPTGELPEREAWPRSRVARASGERHGRSPDLYFALASAPCLRWDQVIESEIAVRRSARLLIPQ